MNSTKLRGNKGERKVAFALIKKGHRILEKNFSVHDLGEIDIISKKKGYIVFTEVKTRSENYLYAPALAVTGKKQSRIIRTAQYYIQKNKIKLQPRFDVAEVVLSEKGKATINIIENAF